MFLDEQREPFSFEMIEYSPASEEVFKVVLEGCLKRQSLKFIYYSPATEERLERRVDPYHLLNYMGSWHLIGYCHLRKEIRDFSLSRISEPRLLDERFSLPSQFDFHEYFHSTFGLYKGGAPKKVVLRFSPEKSKWIRGQVWHKDQKVRYLKDGSMEISFPVSEFSDKEVAEHFELDWKEVAAVVKRVVEEGLKFRKIKTLHLLGIDEVSRKKGHCYLTLVYDLERGRLLWVGLDRKEETLNEFFRWLRKRRTRTLQAICLDMWAPYLASVQRPTPQATLVFDRFHVVRHLNQALDEVRREEVRRLAHQEVIDLKKTRFILLKNPWALTPKENRRLSHLLKLNIFPSSGPTTLKKNSRGFEIPSREKELKLTSNNGSGGPLTLD